MPIYAQNVAGSSAAMIEIKKEKLVDTQSSEFLIKKRAIKSYLLNKQAPLASEVDAFIKACTQYDLDCYLLPAISGVESSFGQYTAPGTNNAFGWGRGLIPFKTFAEGILEVGKGIRENYINKGATTVSAIGRIYCEGGTWAEKVAYFMNQLEKEEKDLLLLGTNKVEL